jgi:hypothetical protein
MIKEKDIRNFKKIKILFIRNVILIVISTLIIIYTSLNIIIPYLLNKILYNNTLKHQEVLNEYIYMTTPLAVPFVTNININLLNREIITSYSQCFLDNPNIIDEIKILNPYILGKTKLDRNLSRREELIFFLNLTKEEQKIINSTSWNSLEKYNEFTYSQVLVVFSKNLDTSEMQKFINNIGDIKPLYSWFSIDIGEITNDLDINSWGYPPPHPIVAEGNDIIIPGGYSITNTTMAETTKLFVKSMKNLKNNSKYLGDELYLYNKLENKQFQDSLKENLIKMNNYISKNDVMYNGMILTAPTKEIIKLKTNDKIGYLKIISVDFAYFRHGM